MRIPDEHKAKLFKVDQANPGNEPGVSSADASSVSVASSVWAVAG